MQSLQAYPQELNSRLASEHVDLVNHFFNEIATTEVFPSFFIFSNDQSICQLCSTIKDAVSRHVTSPLNISYGPEMATVLLLAFPHAPLGELLKACSEYTSNYSVNNGYFTFREKN